MTHPQTAALQSAINAAFEIAAIHIEQRDGSIPYRQEIAAEIRKMALVHGFTAEIRLRCHDRCALYGDPACYRMPELCDPSELPMTVMPCEDCIHDRPIGDANEG